MIRLALTPGEPAGIGPELLIRFAQQTLDNIELVAFADPTLMQQTADALDLPLSLHPFNSTNPQASGGSHLSIQAIPLAAPATPGKLNAANAPYVVQTLREACAACLSDTVDGLVTGPVQKSIINDAGIPFSGHTEFFAQQAKCDKVVMMLATTGLRVALATTHLPLKDVPNQITRDNVSKVLDILIQDLQIHFGIARPRILVCGLNPHAGEGGHLGREEIDTIVPVMETFKGRSCELVGPLPADTLFTEHHLQHADAVLAMYHDQGLPVLKYKGFGNAVNITLGLPFIRTSVDHGTALDLAGKGTANLGSLQVAIDTATDMALAKRSARPPL